MNETAVGENNMARWLALVGGVLGSTTCGALLYAWSVFISPLGEEFGWNKADIALAFAIACLVFGLVTFPAGRLSDKYGPRVVVLIGGIILGIGFFISGFIQSKIQLYITYGVISGLGGGLIYLPPIATAPKWWPHRKALATGFAVVGLGLGSVVMAPLATYIIDNIGWRYVFFYAGVGMGLMAVVSAFCLKVPPKGWKPKGWNPDETAAKQTDSKARDFTHRETYRTLQFWLLYAAYFCGAFAGLMVIGHIKQVGLDKGLDSMTAAVAVSWLGFTNAATRLASGFIADKIGAKATFVIFFALQVVAMLLLFPTGHIYWALWTVAAVIGWNYGAMFTLFPATCVQYFGQTSQGSNYGLMFTAFGFAGFLGPYVGGLLKDSTGTYYAPFVVAAVLLAIAIVIFATIKQPARKSAEQ